MGLVNFDEARSESGKPAMIIDNSAWLHMDTPEFVREVTPYFSVNMVKREDFKRRLDENRQLKFV